MRAMSTCVESLTRGPEADERDAIFAARVAENGRRVFQIAYSVLADRADAEEVAQDALLRAYRRVAALRSPERFRAWVGRIAFRLALNRRRDRSRRLARETAWQAANSEATAAGGHREDDRVLLDRLRHEIDRLPEKLRAVLLLCTVESMEGSEVAILLKIPVGTVRSRLHLARKRLLGALNR